MKAPTLPDISEFSYSLFSLLTKPDDGSAQVRVDGESSILDSTNENNQKNVLISPFSIATLLSLVLAGTTSGSIGEKELLSSLVISSSTDLPLLSNEVLKSTSSVTSASDQKNNSGDGVTFTSVNGIWVKDSILDLFVDYASNVYSAEASVLPDDYKPIDDYISTRTNGLISNMLQGPIDPLVQAVLVNAVYFKGSWKEQFNPSFTAERNFHTVDGETHKAKFMFASRNMYVIRGSNELGGASAVLLDYGSLNNKLQAATNIDSSTNPFKALFLLPSENTEESMNALITSLESLGKGNSNISLKQIINQRMRHMKTELLLPRFKVSWGVQSLVPHLKRMGVSAVFEQDGMFTKMSSDPRLHLDDVLHKATMEVTEEGTVAAAATVGVMMARSAPARPLKVTLDRPFIMLVLHEPTMTPLFIAKMDHPEFI